MRSGMWAGDSTRDNEGANRRAKEPHWGRRTRLCRQTRQPERSGQQHKSAALPASPPVPALHETRMVCCTINCCTEVCGCTGRSFPPELYEAE